MAQLLTTREIVRFLELQKQKAELQFKLDFLKESNSQKSDRFEHELEDVAFSMQKLQEQLEKADVQLAIPNEQQICGLSEKLASTSNKDIRDAISSKQGALYGILAERGALLKANYANKENIAKLSIILAKIDKETREYLLAAVRGGAIPAPIRLKKTDEFHKGRLGIFLNRLGIASAIADGTIQPGQELQQPGEVVLELSNRKVWVSKNVSQRLSEVLQQLHSITPKIQLKNAERQVRQFSEEEETQFSSMQTEYLRLLKEQDELLKDFYDEDKIEIVVG